VRIIAGKYRRRKLATNPGLTTRPITDRVKEILFERLRNELDGLDGRRVADVFAGTGTLGLEALSRGVASVVFIENDRQAFDLLKQNVAMLGVEDDVVCWRTDVLRTSFRPKEAEGFLPYELVFCDPPYRMIGGLRPGTPLYKSLERLARAGITADNALVVLRTPERARFEMPPAWRLEQKLEISTMELHWFRKSNDQAGTADSHADGLPVGVGLGFVN
jgi:16S rRNA (guanine966-N2)-methyltransferase